MPNRIQHHPSPDNLDGAGFVRLDNVSMCYEAGAAMVTALSGLDMDLSVGDTAVVRGGSGSGKTTLVELICGLRRPSSGRIVVGGVSLDGLGDRALLEFQATRIALIPEHPFLASSRSPRETLIEAARLGGASSPEDKAQEILAAIGLSHVPDRPTGSLDPEEQQCLSIARAVAKHAPLLVADDPTAGLKNERAEQALATLQATSHDRSTTVIVTCSESSALLTADQIIDLDQPLDSTGSEALWIPSF